MRSQSITGILLLLSIVGSAVGYFILNSDIQASLIGYTLVRAAKALYYGMGALALVFLVLLFVPQAFNAWKKFAIWFVPLATIIFVLWPESGGMDLLSPYPEQIFQWVSAMYVAISLGIIGWSSKKLPNN